MRRPLLLQVGRVECSNQKNGATCGGSLEVGRILVGGFAADFPMREAEGLKARDAQRQMGGCVDAGV